MGMAEISLMSGMHGSLLSLQGISRSIDRTQRRLATGLKVNSALDNPTNYFASQANLNRAADLNGRKDGVREATMTVGAANNTITAISSLLQAASGVASAALGSSDQTTRNAFAVQFDGILSQIDAIKNDGGYRGINLLNGESLTVEFSENSGLSTLTIEGVDASSSGLGVSHAISSSSSTSTAQVSSNIALGGSDPVVLNSDGTITAVSDYGGVPLPSGLTGVVSVASGTAFSLALQNDGNVVGWGDNSLGQVTIPADLNSVTAVAAGYDFGLALKIDGTVVGWGDNTTGQTSIPAGLTDVVAISAGYGFALALKSDGTVVGWGDDSYGQVTVPPGLTGVEAISAGNDFGLALLSDGTVVGWGGDDYGQSSPVGLTGITAISAGVNFALALDSSGAVVGWGDNSFSQIDIPALGNVIAISAGAYDGLALDDTGAAVQWGPFAPYAPLSGVMTTGSAMNIASNTWSTSSGIRTSLNQVASATDTLRADTQALASNSAILTTRLDFISDMSDLLQIGADSLTLADMNEEAANMLMLQTRQSLTINSLSFGAGSAQSVLRLF